VIPFISLFLVFQYFSLFQVPDSVQDDRYVYDRGYKLTAFILMILSLIKFMLTLACLHKTWNKDYWFWLVVRCAPSIFIVILLFENLARSNHELGDQRQRNSQLSFISFCLWLELFYLLRMWKYTGYLVRMVWLCVVDLQVYGLLFICTLVAFANSQYLLGRQVNHECLHKAAALAKATGEDLGSGTERLLIGASGHGNTLAHSDAQCEKEPEPMFGSFFDSLTYTYKTAMGDWDTDAFSQNENSYYLLWFYWILITIVALIIMLNLLIAIVSETFGKVMSEATTNNYIEKAHLMLHFQSLT